MWHTRRETNCCQCSTSGVIVGGKSKEWEYQGKEQVLADGGSLAALWEIWEGRGRCELDRARGYYSNWHFTSHTCTWSPGANQKLGFAVEGGWRAGTGAAGECSRGVIALLIFVCPCVTPPDTHSPPSHPQHTHTHAHARVHTQPINPTGSIESSVPLKAFGAPVFYTLNIIMHRGARAHWCPTAVIERQGMG